MLWPQEPCRSLPRRLRQRMRREREWLRKFMFRPRPKEPVSGKSNEYLLQIHERSFAEHLPLSITMHKLFEHPHRRFNPLIREWVLVSPHRTKRPWQGKEEKPPEPAGVSYDPQCYLCPGNARAGGARNPQYRST